MSDLPPPPPWVLWPDDDSSESSGPGLLGYLLFFGLVFWLFKLLFEILADFARFVIRVLRAYPLLGGLVAGGIVIAVVVAGVRGLLNEAPGSESSSVFAGGVGAQDAAAGSPPEGDHTVAQVDACVVGPYDAVNVRSGPGINFGVVGTLTEDATVIHTTGQAARDTNGEEWRQIAWGNGTAWVNSSLVTPGACVVEQPRSYCLNEQACNSDDPPNLRTGLGRRYGVIMRIAPGTLGIEGTGASALDDEGRNWVQVRYQGHVGWVAGWLLSLEPCSPVSCSSD